MYDLKNGIKISTYFAEEGQGRAEVYMDKAGPLIQYYDGNGVAFFQEHLENKSREQAESIAEKWTLGYHTLNG